MKTQKIIKESKNLEDVFDLSNVNENQELFSNINKNVIDKFQIETPKNLIINEFIALRSKMYAYKCGDDNKNKVKGISKFHSKNIQFEENKKRLGGEKYEEKCVNYFLRSINHEMDLQKIKTSSLSIFDDKRNYLCKIKKLPWN